MGQDTVSFDGILSGSYMLVVGKTILKEVSCMEKQGYCQDKNENLASYGGTLYMLASSSFWK